MRRFLLCCCIAAFTLAPLSAWADPFVDILEQGWTEADLQHVPPLLKDKVAPTLRSPTITRHFTRVETGASRETEQWLMDHPPIAADIGREIAALPFTLTESWPGTYQIAGGPVREGTVTWLMRDESRALLYGSMVVQSPWGRDVRTLVVVCLRWWHNPQSDRIVHDVFIYGRMPSRAARLMTFMTRPLSSGLVLTRKLRRIISGAETIAESVSDDPAGWAERMLPSSVRPGGDRVAWEQLIAMQARE